MHAPVSVAMSTTASGCSSVASASPSASSRRPSASVLWISTVVPPWIVSTSPSFIADPEGMLSVHIRYPVTALRQPTVARADIDASTAAAPDMSIFIAACIGSVALRLIPPESYITPLPTSARWARGLRGRYVSLIMRGGSSLPALTPSSPPQPRTARASASNTSTCSRLLAATATATSAIRVAVRCPGGEFARSRASCAAPAITRPRPAPRSTRRARAEPATSVIAASVDAGASRFSVL